MAYIKKIKLPRVETPYEILDANAVPNTRKVNGKQLNKDITLSAADVGALPSDTVIPSVPDNIVKYTAISNIETTTPLNADTLQGYTADYFATAAELSTVDGKVSTNTNNIATLSTDLSMANDNITMLQRGKLDKSGSVMTGALVAQNNTNYSVAQVRNIIISTSDPSGGHSGDIWIKYVE